MVTKTVSLKEVTTQENGAVQTAWRMEKTFEGESPICKTRFVTLVPGTSLDQHINSLNAYLLGEGFPSVSAADIAKVKTYISAAWTPENIAPVTQAVTDAIAVQQAAITEAAAKKAEAEAAAAKEIEDAKVRETAANEAKAAAEAAEQASKAAEASAKAAADAAEKENARLAQALAVAEAAAKAAADKQAFDDAVAAAVREAA